MKTKKITTPAPELTPIDTTNRHLVTADGSHVLVMFPVAGRMTPDEALALAAWLVTMANAAENDSDPEDRFARVLAAVQS